MPHLSEESLTQKMSLTSSLETTLYCESVFLEKHVTFGLNYKNYGYLLPGLIFYRLFFLRLPNLICVRPLLVSSTLSCSLVRPLHA